MIRGPRGPNVKDCGREGHCWGETERKWKSCMSIIALFMLEKGIAPLMCSAFIEKRSDVGR